MVDRIDRCEQLLYCSRSAEGASSSNMMACYQLLPYEYCNHSESIREDSAGRGERVAPTSSSLKGSWISIFVASDKLPLEYTISLRRTIAIKRFTVAE